LKIAVFTNAYRPIVSGVVTAINLFRRGLEDAGHEVAIFAPDYYGFVDQEHRVFRYPAIELTRQVKFPVAIPFSTRMARELADFKPNIIHTHHPFVLGRTGSWASRWLGVPLVYTFHTQYEQYAHYIPLPETFVRWVTRTTIRSYVQRVDVLTTPAASVAELLRSYGVKREVSILTNPIDLSLYQNNDMGDLRRREDNGQRTLLYVGRLGQEKNLYFLLESFSRVMTAFSDKSLIRLMLVGDGPEKANLEHYAFSLGLKNSVQFVGMVDYEEIPKYYRAADLFVMASTSEVKPLVLIEALAARLPVVAVAANGSSDTLTHGYDGLLTSENRDEFADAVIGLLEDNERREIMGRNAGLTAKDYGLANVTQRLLEIYESALIKR
jgi:1,2-diacylglycerol 3-alpha-glucosyltransferase